MPNASLWQVEDVFRFLKEKGFEEQAFEFKKQARFIRNIFYEKFHNIVSNKKILI